MEYRRLGNSGLKVSPLCLGTMMFGGPADEVTALRIADRARDQGVNFIDTADGYTGGRSEEVTGRAIQLLSVEATRQAPPVAGSTLTPLAPRCRSTARPSAAISGPVTACPPWSGP